MEENMEKQMSKNALSGKGPINRETDYVETRVDAENAREEAFGVSEKDKLKELEYEQRNAAMDVIRKKGEEMLAKTEFSKELIRQISEENNIAEEYIKIYKATGTVLDKFHKISAWIEIGEPMAHTGKIIITLDIFTEDKNRRKSADINFRKPQCGFDSKNNNNEEYQATIESVLMEIKKKIERKRKKIQRSEMVGQKTPIRENKKPDWTNLKGKRVVNFKDHR